MPTFTCSGCGQATTPKGTHPPGGWKNSPAGYCCDVCWGSTHRIIAAELPVTGVVGDAEAFRAEMTAAFRQATNAYNWAFRQLLAVDFVRSNDMANCPRQPAVNLYKLHNDQGRPCGDLYSQTLSALFRMAASEYRRHRRAALWDSTEGVPLKRFPAPFPVHNQGWATAEANDRPAITLRLHGEKSGPRWTLRLGAGKRRFGSALKWFRWLHASGGAGPYTGCPCRGELNLFTKPCSARDDGLVLFFKRPGGGQTIPQRLVAKLVMWVSREPAREATGAMTLCTDPETLLVGMHDGRVVRPWILNEDHASWRFMSVRTREGEPDAVRRLVEDLRDSHAEHNAWVRRMAEDRKLERRLHLGHDAQHRDALQKRCEKHRRRMKTWIDQVAAMVAGYCVRAKLVGFMYDDSDRSFAPQFPWHQLKTALVRAADARRLQTNIAGGEALETPGVAAPLATACPGEASD